MSLYVHGELVVVSFVYILYTQLICGRTKEFSGASKRNEFDNTAKATSVFIIFDVI